MVLLEMLVGAALSTTQPSAEAARKPVSLRLVGDDGLSLRFADALQAELAHDPYLRPSSTSEPAALTIESDHNIRWDKLNGRKVAIYTVYVGSKRDDPITGVCWENELFKCARDVLRIVRIEAEDH